MKNTETYRIAEYAVKVTPRSPQIMQFMSKYAWRGKADARIKIHEKDIDWEEAKEKSEGMDYGEARWVYEAMLILRRFCARAVGDGILLFHSSALMLGGEAYIFAAPSGMGKSTHARLWRKVFGDKVTMINDDKPFFKKEGAKWYAYGSPWSGKHRLENNIKAPIKGICFLERGQTNEIVRIGFEEGFPRICEQAYFPEERRLCEEAVKLAGDLSKLPMYLMKCTVSEEAAVMSYREMSGERG